VVQVGGTQRHCGFNAWRRLSRLRSHSAIVWSNRMDSSGERGRLPHGGGAKCRYVARSLYGPRGPRIVLPESDWRLAIASGSHAAHG
jgi:hypothetical protein